MREVNKLVILITCVVFAILQSSVLNIIKIGRIRPDLLLVAVIFYAISEGALFGFFVGILCGFLIDVLSGTLFGLSIFTLGITGLVIGSYKNKLDRDTVAIQVVLTFIVAVLWQAFYHFVLNLFLKTSSLGNYLFNLILPYAIYTAAFSPVVFFILSRLSPSPKYRQI